ncbi:unnamed protein product [Trichobilharzia szidati]|nr:unnamed protein product [Trichobilharzia szidati]
MFILRIISRSKHGLKLLHTDQSVCLRYFYKFIIVVPVPGGCGGDTQSGIINTAVTTDIITKNINFSGLTSNRVDLLSYWTSSLQFYAASVPKESGGFACPNLNVSDGHPGDLIYHVFSTPLITAGGAYGAFIDPNPDEVAVVINGMTDFGHASFGGTYIRSFRLSELRFDDQFMSNVLVSRRPATAYIVTVVVEYSVSGGTWKVPYVPVVLFGCRAESLSHFYRVGYNQPALNASSHVDCGILPKDTPIILFPIAVLLLASCLYATSCNIWIWPRCAVSMMIMASVIGLIFFYRFSDDYSNTRVILISSALLPALLALVIFVILWWRCIRPTLHYRRVFGRGPLVKVGNTTSALVNEPWNSDVLDYNHANTSVPFECASQAEYTSTNTVNILPLLNEEEANISMLRSDNNSVSQHLVNRYNNSTNPNELTSNDDIDSDENYVRIYGIRLFRRPRDCLKCANSSSGPYKLFDLRPRRLARLPPILPATFIFIGYLCISLDRTLKLDRSAVSFFAFSIIMSALVMGLLSIFKNFAFGISTAFVGFYTTLCCASFFLIPNSLLPHVVIEYFLRLTWFDVRLSTLRIEFYGLYDVILLVIWFVGSVFFGLLTLCLVRLQDARELAEAHHYSTVNTELPYASVHGLNRVSTTSDSTSLLGGVVSGGDIRPSSRSLHYVPRIIPVPCLSPNLNSRSNMHTSHSSLRLHEKVDGENAIEDSTTGNYCRPSNSSTPKVLTENQPLLQNRFYNNYGGLRSNSAGPPVLLPLSRVQLAAVAGAATASHSMSFSPSSAARNNTIGPTQSNTIEDEINPFHTPL